MLSLTTDFSQKVLDIRTHTTRGKVTSRLSLNLQTATSLCSFRKTFSSASKA